MISDLFSKLRTNSGPGEICKCGGAKPIKLMYALSENPIYCIDCNLEIEPDSLSLTSQDVEEIVSWRNVYGSIYLLWLDSGYYEAWAEKELLDIRSAANLRGISLANRLELKRPCYFWYFQNQAIDRRKPMQNCPNCGHGFEHYDQGVFPQLICKDCRIITEKE